MSVGGAAVRTRGRARRQGALGAVAILAAAGSLGAQETVGLPAGDRSIRAPLADVYAVGGAMEAEEWQIFGELGGPGSVAFDGAGNLYVFDRSNFRVAVVDPSGALLREFGKEGEGPDEWRMPVSMSVLRDGRVVITDLGHRAYLVYGPDGALESTVPMEIEGGGLSVGALQPDPRGGHLYSNAGGTMRIRVRTTGGAADVSPGRVVERLDLSDGSKRPFFTAWDPPRPDARETTLSGGGATVRVAGAGPRAFEPRLHVGVLPDGGLAVVDSTAWTVKIVGPEGTLRRVLRRPSVAPREVTGRIEERERERRLAELEAGEGPRMRVMVQGPGGGARPISDDQIREMQRSQVAEMTFFEEIPAVADLRAGWEGTLWIERTPTDWWEDGPVDVVTPEGRYVGTLAAGEPGIPAAFGPGGLVAYIERDEFDVPTISVKRLPEGLR